MERQLRFEYPGAVYHIMVPVAGSQFGYAFDGIGNRTSATVNGRTGSYTANTANQYTQRQVPGFLDIRGTAIAASKVTVKGRDGASSEGPCMCIPCARTHWESVRA